MHYTVSRLHAARQSLSDGNISSRPKPARPLRRRFSLRPVSHVKTVAVLSIPTARSRMATTSARLTAELRKEQDQSNARNATCEGDLFLLLTRMLRVLVRTSSRHALDLFQALSPSLEPLPDTANRRPRSSYDKARRSAITPTSFVLLTHKFTSG